MESQSSTPSEVVKKWGTWQILAEPHLDTEHTQEWKDALASELERRGITGFALRWRQWAAAMGLWWNVLWWEWGLLDGKDIILGWMLNFAVILPCVIAWFFGWVPGIVTLVAWLILTRP